MCFQSQRHLGLETRMCNSCVSVCFLKTETSWHFMGSTGLRSLVFVAVLRAFCDMAMDGMVNLSLTLD